MKALRTHYDSLPFGGRKALAKALGVSQSYLSQMASGNRPVPDRLCAAIARETGGAVTVQDLRPALFPGPRQEAA